MKSEGARRTRALCRRNLGNQDGHLPRATKFGDKKTADHKILNEHEKSRFQHRYDVVVQHLISQWLQSYPSKTKTSQETVKSLRKFIEPEEDPKVVHTDDSFGV